MKVKLWLDDCRPAPKGWTWHLHVDNMIEDIEWLMRHGDTIEMISLDNDLGELEKEGYKVLDWLESLQIPIEFGINIHSANPVARDRMRAVIQRNGWKEVF
jgi:hypothetical protein